MNPDSKGHLETIVAFLRSIGITVIFQPIEEETFLPGILISKGDLIVDENKLKFPGDLLHEAGHIAMLTPAERAVENGNLESEKNIKTSMEIGVICWTWAALVHLGLEPEVVFHPSGYKDDSDWIIEEFKSGSYMGLPLLEWLGMTLSPKKANELGGKPFPEMICWLRKE